MILNAYWCWVSTVTQPINQSEIFSNSSFLSSLVGIEAFNPNSHETKRRRRKKKSTICNDADKCMFLVLTLIRGRPAVGKRYYWRKPPSKTTSHPNTLRNVFIIVDVACMRNARRVHMISYDFFCSTCVKVNCMSFIHSHTDCHRFIRTEPIL